MATRRANGEDFERINSDSDTECLEESDSGKFITIIDHNLFILLLVHNLGRRKTYRLSSNATGPFGGLCPPKIRKRDAICLAVGAAIIVGAIILFIIIGVVFQGGNNGNPQPNTYSSVRLPTDLEPLLYHIHLTPDLDTLAVTGTANIMIKTLSATNKVVLHSKDMTISSTSLKINDDVSSIKSTYFVEEHDFFIVEVNSLQAGDNIELSLEFNYTLRDDLVGFYLSTYKAANGDTVRLATTQFEPTDARTAFPCFDEPAMKSNFSITITHSEEYTATSNMPVKKSTKRRSSDNLVTTEFETSYHMSTYLIALIVSDFSCSDPSTINNHIEVSSE